MAIPAYKDRGGVNTSTGSASLNLSVPATRAARDILLAIVDINTGTALTPPAGWTLLRDSGQFNQSRVVVWMRECDGSEAASYTFTWGEVCQCSGVIACYTPGQSGGPTAAMTASSGSISSSTSLALAGIAAAPPGLLVGVIATFGANGGVTPPGTMTERMDAVNGNNLDMDLADEVFAGGATGTRTFTWTTAIASKAGALILLPAGGGPRMIV